MEERMYMDDEMEIDLKQLLLFVLKKWKVILLFVLIGALIGAGFGMMKAKPEASQYNEEKAVLYAAYEKAMEDYEAQTLHNAQSALYQLNPNAMYSSVRTYLLSAQSEAQLGEMSRQLTAVVQDEALLAEMADVCGLNGDITAAASLVSFTTEKMQSAEIGSYLTLTVSAPSKQSSLAMDGIVKAKLDAASALLKKSYGDTACQLVSDVQKYGYAENVFKAQQAGNNTMSYKKTLRDNAKAMLTADEITYYSGNPTPDVQELAASAKIKTIAKWAVIAAVVVAFLAACCYCVVYLFNGTLKTAEELRCVFGLYIISYLNTSSKGKKTLAERLLTGGEMPLNTTEYLFGAVEALGAEKTLLCGNAAVPAVADVKQQLLERFPALTAADNLATDDQAIAAASEAEGVIMVVQLWHTTTDELKREMEIVRKLKKTVKGVVVLKA